MEHENSAILPQLFQDLVADIQSRLDYEPVDRAHLDTTPGHKGQIQCTRDALEKERAISHLALDAFTLYAKGQLSRLGTRQNRHTITYCIPNEILSYILELAGKDCRARWGARVILNLSHVSRRWREVALETPRLWTCPLMFSTKFVDICIARSRNLPLDICPGARRYADRLHEVLPHRQRWRSLRLSYSPKDSKLVQPSLSAPAQMLETLHLRCRNTQWDKDCASDSKVLHRNPFRGNTPHVREVLLSGVFFPFTSPIFSGLLKLSLNSMQFDKVDTIYQLLRALEACPCMESLTFSNSLKFGPDVTANLQLLSTAPFVSLPHLQLLRVKQQEAEPALVFILSRLTTPSNSTLSINVLYGVDGLASIVPVHVRRSPHYNLQNLSSARQLKISMTTHYDDDVRFVLYGSGDQNLDSDSASQSEFSINFRKGIPLRDASTQLFETLGTVFPMPHLQSLCIDIHLNGLDHTPTTSTPSKTAFVEFLGRHPSITTIALSGCAPGFVKSLIITPTRRVCPALEEPSIRKCSVRNGTMRKLVASRPMPGLLLNQPDDLWGLQRLRIVACNNVIPETLSDLGLLLEVATDDDMGESSESGDAEEFFEDDNDWEWDDLPDSMP
ncbi:hypothetical protein BOTBODRAFT_170976 [Botryobasidium botryosum FD-172 SS1]|uniref:F-box domain-containing protein n=1 Tax=Botryobasidium botryosum (strain FD-172 SS1) TaxID=930990 RepID=A0A067MWC0_BOTB1|nr:hypothetical protein BOTBODRAFT_170976 [Botryobasidium botryosum FD-172 SS1]